MFFHTRELSLGKNARTLFCHPYVDVFSFATHSATGEGWRDAGLNLAVGQAWCWLYDRDVGLLFYVLGEGRRFDTTAATVLLQSKVQI